MRQNLWQSMVGGLAMLFVTGSIVGAFAMSGGIAPGSSTSAPGLGERPRGSQQTTPGSPGESAPMLQPSGQGVPETQSGMRQQTDTPGSTTTPRPLGSTSDPAPLGSTSDPAPLGSTSDPAPLGRTPAPEPLGSSPPPSEQRR